ncbi:DAPG hydrolase family protein [Nocardia sp. CY41]|uniref:DAPG hydrolase family protein n=1 Tax=Nocardia sp. CY41 TaxID=2608686 RepID=UPI003FA5E0A4
MLMVLPDDAFRDPTEGGLPPPAGRRGHRPSEARRTDPLLPGTGRRSRAHGYSATETGYSRTRSGLARVTVRTGMPRVTAAMWDRWFG